MVSKILKLFNSEIGGVHQAAFLIGFFTLLAQVLGLVRDRALAHFFGAGLTLDIYYASFRVPDLIFATAASLVSISVIIPFINKVEGDQRRVKNIVDSLFNAFSLLMVVVSVIAFFAIPSLSRMLFSGLGDQQAIDQIILLSRLLLLQPICLGISNIFGSLTQLRKRFVLYALSPIVYNAAIIGGVFFLRPFMGISGVVWGVIVGGLLHFVIQIPFIKKEGLLPSIQWPKNIDWKLVKEVFTLSIPRTLTLSASMIELVVLTALAASLTIGSISILSFSFNIQSVPLGIVGVSYALAAFPTLSAYFARGERDKFIAQIVGAVRHVIFWSIPIAALFIVLRAQIVRTVLGSGNFNWDNTRLTAACLAIFVISLVGQALELLFIRAYYAAGQTRKPLVINLVSSLITVVSPVLFIMWYRVDPTFGNFFARLFRVEGIPGVEILMLPLGYTLGTIINTVAFWFKFEKDFSKGLLIQATAKSWIGALGAGIIGGFFAYLGLNMFDTVFDLDTVRGVFLHGFTGGMLGIAVAILVLKILKNEELDEILLTLQKKIPLTTIFGKLMGKKPAPVDLQKSGEVLVLEPDKLEP